MASVTISLRCLNLSSFCYEPWAAECRFFHLLSTLDIHFLAAYSKVIMSSRFAFVGTLGLALVLFGAGCNPFSKTASVASGASSETLTSRLVFTNGDTLDVGQTFFGLGGLPSSLWKGQELERSVTIDSYQPERYASLSWKAETDQETEASAKARTEYEKTIAGRKRGDVYPPPPAVSIETVTARGSVNDIDLQNSQTLSLPAYWTPGIITLAGQRSGIWLSQNAYREMVNATSTSIYFDITTQTAGDLLNSSKEWADAVKRLRNEEVKAAEKKDPARLVRETDKIDWPLTINGQSQTVKAWKAKNAFGELVILANQQNPLILKATVNPVFPGVTSAAQGSIDWNKLFGYEVKRITSAGAR